VLVDAAITRRARCFDGIAVAVPCLRLPGFFRVHAHTDDEPRAARARVGFAAGAAGALVLESACAVRRSRQGDVRLGLHAFLCVRGLAQPACLVRARAWSYTTPVVPVCAV